MTTTAVARREERESLEAILKRPAYEARFKEVLGLRAMQFMSSILSVGRTMPDVEPRSIVASAMIAATLDLPIEKNLGFAWLVPYNSRDGKFCQFQMGYKGYIQLALRTGRYERMNARAINAEALNGYDEVGEPRIDWSKVDETKPAIGYAFGFKLVGGFTKVCFWPKQKVVEHAKRYSQAYRSGKGSTWETHFDQMALKTVIANELSDWGILSIQWQQARRYDQGVVRDLDAGVQYVDSDAPGETFPVPTAAPTPFQQAVGGTEQAAAGAPAMPPVKPTDLPRTEPAPAARRRGRPPGRPSNTMVEAPLTQEEAKALEAQGIPVAQGAVAPTPEGKTAPGTVAVDANEAKELAAAGLAPAEPEPEPSQPTQGGQPPQAPEQKPAFTPVPGESKAVTEVRRLAFDSNVSEEQIMRFLDINHLSAGEKKLTDFTQNNREVKLMSLVKVWKTVLPKIANA